MFSESLATRRCHFYTWKTRNNRSCHGQAGGALPHPVPWQRVLIFQEKGTWRAALSAVTEGPGPLDPWVSALSVRFTGISSSGPSPQASTEGCPGWVYDQETLLMLKAEDTCRAATMVPAPTPPTSGTPRFLPSHPRTTLPLLASWHMECGDNRS